MCIGLDNLLGREVSERCTLDHGPTLPDAGGSYHPSIWCIRCLYHLQDRTNAILTSASTQPLCDQSQPSSSILKIIDFGASEKITHESQL
jgi:hypothetical protein